MVDNGEIPIDFKKTEIGTIPDDWIIYTIEELTPKSKKYGIVDGPFGSNLKTIHYRKSGIPIITSGYVTNGKFYASDYLYVDKEKFKQEKRSTVRGGDIVMAKIGANCGASAILSIEHPEGILSGNALKITIDESRFSTKIISQILWRNYSIGKFEELRTTGAQPAISMANLKKFKLPLPASKAEQTAIATALSDTDVLIENLEKLITKKQNIKQGAMQELLTGRRRLAGYSGVWETIELKDIVKQFIVPMRDKPKRFDGNIPWCRIEDFNGKYLSDSKSNQYVNGEIIKEMNLKILPAETLIVSCSADLGRCAIVKNPLTTNQTFIGLVFNENIASNEFFYYYMTYNAETLNMLSSGTTISYLSREQFEIFKVYVPNSKTEQSAIAKTLSDMDCEIEAIEQKLKKYGMIKMGMMQVLLTGKIRLL